MMAIIDVVDTLMEIKIENNWLHSLYENKFELICLVIIGINTVLTLIFYLFPLFRPFSSWPILVGFVALFLLSISATVSGMKYICGDCTNQFLLELKENITKETLYIENLSKHSLKGLEQADARLDYEIHKVLSRLGAMVGSFDKVGIIPAAVGLYLSFKKVSEGEFFSAPSLVLIAIVVGIYLGAVLATKVTWRYRYIHMLLKAAIELKKREFARTFSYRTRTWTI